MIRIKFRDGTQWRLAPDDTFVDIDGVDRRIDDIEEIDLIDVGYAVARGRAGTEDIRGLRIRDEETEVVVNYPMSIEHSEELAHKLLAKTIRVARSMPVAAPDQAG